MHVFKIVFLFLLFLFENVNFGPLAISSPLTRPLALWPSPDEKQVWNWKNELNFSL